MSDGYGSAVCWRVGVVAFVDGEAVYFKWNVLRNPVTVDQYNVSVKGLISLSQMVSSVPPVQYVMLHYPD